MVCKRIIFFDTRDIYKIKNLNRECFEIIFKITIYILHHVLYICIYVYITIFIYILFFYTYVYNYVVYNLLTTFYFDSFKLIIITHTFILLLFK